MPNEKDKDDSIDETNKLDLDKIKEEFPCIYEEFQKPPSLELDSVISKPSTDEIKEKIQEKEGSKEGKVNHENLGLSVEERKKYAKLIKNRETKMPSPLEHLARCEDIEESFEILEYFEDLGEISSKKVTEIKNRLKKGELKFCNTRSKGDLEKRGI